MLGMLREDRNALQYNSDPAAVAEHEAMVFRYCKPNVIPTQLSGTAISSKRTENTSGFAAADHG
jgi:hypothetical protein